MSYSLKNMPMHTMTISTSTASIHRHWKHDKPRCELGSKRTCEPYNSRMAPVDNIKVVLHGMQWIGITIQTISTWMIVNSGVEA